MDRAIHRRDASKRAALASEARNFFDFSGERL
jgi:hypothetical protein